MNGQLEAIHDDQVGRLQVVTNASQAVVWSAQNWPFTQNVTVANTAPLNLGFPGQYYDAETGLWRRATATIISGGWIVILATPSSMNTASGAPLGFE